ncbi:hypothetical protein [Pectinatus frisingensis]|jgi:hypothetical protein|uniref:hypothetical protein n=1 Tax=Pectinatus frisingensis TaxID=865 RepID=UPI0015F6E3EB|nr:hypothetical protein [Pectinatus frisingensis]
MNELPLFKIENFIGGDQEWFTDYWMKLGGCGAVTACDICIYFAMFFNKTDLYPFNLKNMTKNDYIKFSQIMKDYLSPRIHGINTLEIFINGLQKYLFNHGEQSIQMKGLYSNCSLLEFKTAVRQQIDQKLPVPYLNLKHKNHAFNDYVWHWFWLAGYEEFGDITMVKVITYGTFRWLSLNKLWDSGYKQKGGIILFDIN